MKAGPNSERTLVLTPEGRDAEIATRILSEAGLPAFVCGDVADVCHELRRGAALAIIAKEAITDRGLRQLGSFCAGQPTWSDMPIILLTQRGSVSEGDPAAARYAEILGNVSFLERPFHATTLASVARTAIRSRQRQYDTRSYLEALGESESRYRLALRAGRAGTWETDYEKGMRRWSEEGQMLFGLKLENGLGTVGGDADEFRSALHPADRHLADLSRRLQDEQDSVETEYRVVKPDGSIVWLSGRSQVTKRGLDGRAQRLISIMVDTTERKNSEEHIKFLMREISHRSKNLLSVIQAMARQTAGTAGTMNEFVTRFNMRLQGLAASHDILTDQSWYGAPLAELARKQLEPFVEAGSERLELKGPHVVLTAPAAQAMGLALHELATNAAKYGGLSSLAGRVKISWVFEESSQGARQLRLNWVEEGGPRIVNQPKKGFGHLVMERMIAASLGGEVAVDYATEGLRWALSIPIENLADYARIKANSLVSA